MRQISKAFAGVGALERVDFSLLPGEIHALVGENGAGKSTLMRILSRALPHEGIKYVEQGILAATFQYPTGGADAIDIALKILKGERVEKNIILGTRLFTKDTLPDGQYIPPGG